jgi:histidyl-tRNA synthetase
VTLELNSLGTPEARIEYKRELVDYFSSHRDALDADSLRRLERNPLRILDSKNEKIRELIAGAPVLPDYLDDESRSHFETVKTLLADVGVGYRLNPRLVRGLDYYSRTVFEWVTDKLGSQGAICSGGRYDGLVAELGGRDTPAVGWALGIERVVELMRAEGQEPAVQPPDVFVVAVGDAARRKAFTLAESLRHEVPGLRVVLGLSSSLKAEFKRADKSGSRFAVILGDEEIAAGRISLKDLRGGGGQQSLEESELAVTLSGTLEPVE